MAAGRTRQRPRSAASCLGTPAHGRGMASAGARAASLRLLNAFMDTVWRDCGLLTFKTLVTYPGKVAEV